MARYLYKKYSLAECWNTNITGNIGKTTIFSNPSDIDIHQWNGYPSGNIMYFNEPFKDKYIYNRVQYKSCSSDGFYHNYTSAETYGNNVGVGNVGMIAEGLAVYKGIVKKVGTPGVSNSYELEVTHSLDYEHLMQNFTIYKHNTSGRFIEDIIAEDGTYPINGIQDGFWYKRMERLFPTFYIKVNNAIKETDNGWVKVGNELKGIDKIWIKADGILKEI